MAPVPLVILSRLFVFQEEAYATSTSFCFAINQPSTCRTVWHGTKNVSTAIIGESEGKICVESCHSITPHK
jgi:hypothetical protein